MAPQSTIILCRHSQAEHNVGHDYEILDAPLTQLGREQSAALPAQVTQLSSEIDLICTSPLKRTLQSTLLGWGPTVDRLGIENVICLPQAQECNAFPCDIGSPKKVLESIEEFKGFVFDRLTPDWTSKEGFYAANREALAKRAQWVRQFLRDRPEESILLVAHGDILRQITASSAGPSTYLWRNAEVRVYKFDPKTVDSEECYLYQERDASAAPGYLRTATNLVPGVL